MAGSHTQQQQEGLLKTSKGFKFWSTLAVGSLNSPRKSSLKKWEV